MGVLQHNQLATIACPGSKITWFRRGGNQRRQKRHNSRHEPEFDCVYTLLRFASSAHPTGDNIHQTGTSYSSNNAGDGPEKTRDRKSWFPRFKSNWLGTFRSKQMFLCCECAVPPSSGNRLPSQTSRYKGAEGKHCRCGKDQWHLAKSVEETEYNRRMAISKALGGMRYDEAVQRLRNKGQSELDFNVSEFINTSSLSPSQNTEILAMSSSSSSSHKRARSGSLSTRIYAASHVNKCDLSTLPLTTSHVYEHAKPLKDYVAYNSVYSNNVIEDMHPQQHPPEYEHLPPASFGDEESFGDLLQGILEDDSRGAETTNMDFNSNQTSGCGGARIGYATEPSQAHFSVASLKRTVSMPAYAAIPSFIASPPCALQDNSHPSRRAGLNHAPAFLNYSFHALQQQPMFQHQPPNQLQRRNKTQEQVYTRPLSMTPSAIATTTSTSFST
ncbi:hypothetical protein Plhal304r1_c002g0008011 [Plasmopara halstedii]